MAAAAPHRIERRVRQSAVDGSQHAARHATPVDGHAGGVGPPAVASAVEHAAADVWRTSRRVDRIDREWRAHAGSDAPPLGTEHHNFAEAVGGWLRKAFGGKGSDEARAAALRGRCEDRAALTIQQCWRGWGGGAYPKTVSALRELATLASPMEKAECVLRALNLLAFEAARRLQAAAAAARQRDGTANSTRDASASNNAGGECDQLSADEILPLFVFALVRARVPCLYAEARLLADFLPKNCALGRYGYSLTTLQAALHFLLETSWEKIEHANRAEVAQRKEKKKRKYRSRVEALAQNEMLVELCDCPTGATHACLLQDSNGRLLRRGDHIVRLGASRNRHAIFYGGTDGQEVLHHESRRGKTSLGDQRAKLLRKVRVGICAIEAFAKGDAIVVADYRGGALAGGRAARTRAPSWAAAATTPSIYGRSNGPTTARRAPPTPLPSNGNAPRCRRRRPR